jgi:ureidoglycolate lyase
MKILQMERLTREAFAPFGDVIELDGARHFPINGGTTERYHDLAQVDVGEQGGRPLINLFRAQPRALPVEINMMERHPLGSQAFLPLSEVSYLIVVAPAGEFDPAHMRGFWTEGWQRVSDFVVVDRAGAQPNCDEIALAEPWHLARVTYAYGL